MDHGILATRTAIAQAETAEVLAQLGARFGVAVDLGPTPGVPAYEAEVRRLHVSEAIVRAVTAIDEAAAAVQVQLGELRDQVAELQAAAAAKPAARARGA